MENNVNKEMDKEITDETDEKNSNLEELAIEASEIVSRLEQAASGKNLEETAPPPAVLLGPEQRSPNEIIASLTGLLNHDDDGDPLSSLDSISRLALISHTIGVYCTTAERNILNKLINRIVTDSTRWLGQIFGFLDARGFYHEDYLEGLYRITRLMLYYKYNRYLEDGTLALHNSLPTIYSNAETPVGVMHNLCRNLGLPLACIRIVPVNTHFGSHYTMDLGELQTMLVDDTKAGRTPLMVIADAGTPVTGHVDNLMRLQEICKEHNIWLHVRGHAIASFALPIRQHNGHNPQFVNSITLRLGQWLGIPGLPIVTLFRFWDNSDANKVMQKHFNNMETTLLLMSNLHTDHQMSKIPALPIWTTLQALGMEGVQERIRNAFIASEKLFTAVDSYRHIRVLSQKPGGPSGSCTVSELMEKPVNISLLLETTATCVVFQFIPEIGENDTLERIPVYYDKLNSWLGQILQLDVPQVPIDICEVDDVGVVLRFCPLENAPTQPTTEDIQNFVQCLQQQLVILRSTVQQKEIFCKLVETSPVLKVVELPEWAGLGGVRYAPEGWEQLLTDQAKEELNNLNKALVDALRSTDSAFSLGEGVDGLMCVRFGMLTAQSDVEELLNLVVRVGQSVEENSRVLDSMSEIVKKGIETATLDLQKENEERLWQEGILRQVPVVGTFVNWWSPKGKEAGVRGRSLNLTQGVVESTENIYKYHMQMSGMAPVGTKSPPTPLIQTPVGSTHSRSSSHASNQSLAHAQYKEGTIVVNNTIEQEERNGTDNNTEAITVNDIVEENNLSRNDTDVR